MRRREFIGSLIGSAVAWPYPARAQQPAIPAIGYLSTRSPKEAKYVTAAFNHGLNELGYFEGQSLVIEYRWAELQYDRLPTGSTWYGCHRRSWRYPFGTRRQGSDAISIVFVSAGDPVCSDLFPI
jgi:putative ABC transport system substrate-binding protein